MAVGSKHDFKAPPAKINKTVELTDQEYTWQQVAQHNTESSCWVICQGVVYDVTAFVDRHPGGKDFFLLAAGRDVTDLLPSYHWWTEKPYQVLQKYRIGTLTGPPEFVTYPQDTGFFKELREQVADYFKKTKQHPKDPLPGLIRLIPMLLIALGCYAISYPFADMFSWSVRVMAAVVFGVFQALPLLHAMHDASHSAIGTSPLGWKIISVLTMDLFAGASINSWLHQHVLSHHVYTNITQADADLPLEPKGDVRRVSPYQKWASFYKYQWLFIPPLYTLLGLKFRYQDIANTLVAGRNGPLRVTKIRPSTVAHQVFVKLFFITWRLVVPFVYFNIPAQELITLFLISELTTGGYLAYNFQVSHVSPIAEFPNIQDGKSSDKKDTLEEWAVHQVRTSVDYAHGDKLMTFLCGALNYQTEHHLFPAISQYHYPALAPIVMRLCKKHNIEYNYIPTFWEAFKLHVRHLYLMGLEKADGRYKTTYWEHAHAY